MNDLTRNIAAARILMFGGHRAVSKDTLAAALASVDPDTFFEVVQRYVNDYETNQEPDQEPVPKESNSDSDCGPVPVPARRYSLTSPPPSPFDGEEALKEFNFRLQDELLERVTGDNLAQSYVALLHANTAVFCMGVRAHFADLTVTEALELFKLLTSTLPDWMLGDSAYAPARLSHEEQGEWAKSFRNLEILESYISFLMTTEIGYWRSMSDMRSYCRFLFED